MNAEEVKATPEYVSSAGCGATPMYVRTNLSEELDTRCLQVATPSVPSFLCAPGVLPCRFFGRFPGESFNMKHRSTRKNNDY